MITYKCIYILHIMHTQNIFGCRLTNISIIIILEYYHYNCYYSNELCVCAVCHHKQWFCREHRNCFTNAISTSSSSSSHGIIIIILPLMLALAFNLPLCLYVCCMKPVFPTVFTDSINESFVLNLNKESWRD